MFFMFHIVSNTLLYVLFFGFLGFFFFFWRGGEVALFEYLVVSFFCFFSLLLFFYSVYVIHVSYSVKYVAICVCVFFNTNTERYFKLITILVEENIRKLVEHIFRPRKYNNEFS